MDRPTDRQTDRLTTRTNKELEWYKQAAYAREQCSLIMSIVLNEL